MFTQFIYFIRKFLVSIHGHIFKYSYPALKSHLSSVEKYVILAGLFKNVTLNLQKFISLIKFCHIYTVRTTSCYFV